MKPAQYAVPNALICHKHGMRLTGTITATPSETRKPDDAPIVQGLTLVSVVLSCGCKRHFGVDKAWIDSDLRMHVEGGFINPRNELAKGWRL